MNDSYAIRLAKTKLRDAYCEGNVNRVLSVFADGYNDMSAGLASFYGIEARAVLKHRLRNLFTKYDAQLAVTIISIRVEGPMAFDWGWHKLTLTPKKVGRSITKRTRRQTSRARPSAKPSSSTRRSRTIRSRSSDGAIQCRTS